MAFRGESTSSQMMCTSDSNTSRLLQPVIVTSPLEVPEHHNGKGTAVVEAISVLAVSKSA